MQNVQLKVRVNITASITQTCMTVTVGVHGQAKIITGSATIFFAVNGKLTSEHQKLGNFKNITDHTFPITNLTKTIYVLFFTRILYCIYKSSTTINFHSTKCSKLCEYNMTIKDMYSKLDHSSRTTNILNHSILKLSCLCYRKTAQ